MAGITKSRIWPSRGDSGIPSRHRRACEYVTFTPEPVASLRPPISAELAGVLSEAESAIQALNAGADPALTPLGRLLLRTESIASSKVEGLQMGTRALARAEANKETGRTVAATAEEILANINAMEFAVNEAAQSPTFTLDDVRAIHRSLMENGPKPGIAGEVRTEQNWIGGNDWTPCGADYVPPPAEELPPLLDDLCVAINDGILPPLMQAGLVHAQFENLHPFADGNGRTGRALIQVVLRRRGLAPNYVPPISVVLAKRRTKYIEGLVNFRGPDVGPWLETFLAAALEAAALARGYLEAVEQLKSRWVEQLRDGPNPRRGAAAWDLINELPGLPLVTTPVATARLNRAKSNVQQAIEQLVHAGVLEPVRDSKRNQVWEATGLLPLLEALEAGQPAQSGAVELAPDRGGP
jgi:Fic family protein